jgi:hypothetical protein
MSKPPIPALSTLDTLFKATLGLFFKDEIDSILNDVNERSLCGSLALHMDTERRRLGIHSYRVDVEYNRNRGKYLKTIKDRHERVIAINADVILHSRGTVLDQDNLIAFEMKKSNASTLEKQSDRERLEALTKDTFDDVWSFDGSALPEHVCRYALGVYMELNVRGRKVLLERYIKGKCVWSKESPF